MNRRILFSSAMIIFVGAVVAGGTGAFFSDEETSSGNTFMAGDIDLQIDKESYYNGVLREDLSWEATDLTNELFFNYDDLKPGDEGEDTISLHVGSNPAWVCMDVELTETDDNGLTEPESAVDATGGAGEGELQNYLNFVWWPDDGDNVLEDDEAANAQLSGSIANFASTSLAISDASGNALYPNPLGTTTATYVGKAWCFGDLGLNPLTQDATSTVRSPADPEGAGITCDGSLVGNESQSDSITGDVTFRAVQSRNNEEFLCQEVTATGTLVITKTVINGNGGTSTVSDFTPLINGVPTVFGTSTQPAGSYVITETGPSGYAATFGGDCDSGGNVTVPAGGTATCTIVNDDIATGTATITLTKSFAAGAATTSTSSFTFRINGAAVPLNTPTPVNAGFAYPIGEDAFGSYFISSVTGDAECPASAPSSSGGFFGTTSVLTAGQSVICNLENDLP